MGNFRINADRPDDTAAIWRILDAAANRAEEGLRVVEDYVRFALDDRHLTVLAKQLRHELAGLIGQLSPANRIAARDTVADVGTEITTSGESHRASATSVVAASLKRLQQALRSLEEYAKIIDPRIAAQFEALRYQSYTLERAVSISVESVARLAGVRLYVLIDGRGSSDELAELAEGLIGSGAQALQLRDKGLTDRELLQRARRLREVTAPGGALMVVNDRPDIAKLAAADGVHIGQDELSVKDARAIIGPRMLIGVSTHSIEQARQAVLDGANYIGVGPTFESATKQFSHFTGLELLRQVAAEIRLPAFAIGGIGLDNLPRVLETGFTRVAASAAIFSASDPATATRDLAHGLVQPLN